MHLELHLVGDKSPMMSVIKVILSVEKFWFGSLWRVKFIMPRWKLYPIEVDDLSISYHQKYQENEESADICKVALAVIG